MADNNEDDNGDKFANQYLSVFQDYFDQMSKDPKSLEDMIGNVMELQKSFLGSDSMASKILESSSSQDSSVSSMLKTIAEDVQQIKKRVMRLERFLLRPKVKSSSDSEN